MRFTDESLEPFGKELLHLPVESNLGYKTPLVFRIVRTLQEAGYLPSYGCHMAELSFEEAVANAMVHGNKLDPQKQIDVRVFGDDARFGVMIDDQGEGFTPDAVPDPNDPENLFRDRGRGIMLIDHYMDEVAFSNGGRRVRMVRQRQDEPDPGATPPPELPEIEHISPDELNLDDIDLGPVSVSVEEPEAVALPDQIELGDAEAMDWAEPTATVGGPDEPVSIVKRGDVAVATVNAMRVAEENADTIRVHLLGVTEHEAKLVLDLTPVEFLSSVGIGTIMAIYKSLLGRKGRLALCGLQPAVHGTLKASGVVKVLPVEPDAEAAVQRLSRD